MRMVRSLSLLVLLLHVVLSTHHETPSGDHLWCHEEEEEEGAEGVAFEAALDHVHSRNMSQTALQKLLDETLLRFPCRHSEYSSNTTCSNWLTAGNVYKKLNLTSDSQLTEDLFGNASVIVVAYLFRFSAVCSGSSDTTWDTLNVENFYEILLHAPDAEGHEVSECPDGNESLCLHESQLESVLRTISSDYVPGELRNISSCGGEGSVAEKAIQDWLCSFGELKSFSSRSLRRLVVRNRTETVMRRDVLGKMAAIVFMKLLSGHCIAEVEEAPSIEEYLHSLFETFGENNTCGISHGGLEKIEELLKIGEHHEEGGMEQEGHEHANRRRRRSAEEHEHEEADVDVATTCVPMDDLLRGFKLDVTGRTLSRTDLYRLCPALLQQATIGCRPAATPQEQPSKETQPSSAEVYGYGTLAVAIVSACVVIALVVVRWKGTKVYRYLISTMLGLAVGSLAGDSLLHLIPQALGVHTEGAEHAHQEGESAVEPFVWKALCGCGSLWFYYNLQLFLYKAGSIAGCLRRVLGRSRSQSPDSDLGHVDLNGASSVATLNNYSNRSTDDVTLTSLSSQGNGHNKDVENETKQKKEEEEEGDVVHSHSSVAWMITIGDGIHNFADGLAMGAAFSTGLQTGIGTTIAIFTHELPHEFGDTAVLLSAGWSTKKVLLFQLLSQLTAFIGLYIGISVSENSDGAQQWIAAVASGMFLYIALADVIPELIEFFSVYSPWLIFITSNIGIFIGFLAMLLLAIYEEKISIG